MNKVQAERIIVISVVVFMVSVIGGHLITGKPGTAQQKDFGRKITAGFLAFLFASLLAEALPEVGALLALSIGFYAFLHDGLPLIGKYYNKEGEKKQTSTHPPIRREQPAQTEPIPGTSPELRGEQLV